MADFKESSSSTTSTTVKNKAEIADNYTRERELARKRLGRTGRAAFASVPAILSFILIFLLVVNLFLVMTDNKDNLVSFEKFLNIVANCKTIDVSWLSHWGVLDSLLITGDWGILNFVRDFINRLMSSVISVIEVASFLSTASLNMFLFTTQFIGFIVIGA